MELSWDMWSSVSGQKSDWLLANAVFIEQNQLASDKGTK